MWQQAGLPSGQCLARAERHVGTEPEQSDDERGSGREKETPDRLPSVGRGFRRHAGLVGSSRIETRAVPNVRVSHGRPVLADGVKCVCPSHTALMDVLRGRRLMGLFASAEEYKVEYTLPCGRGL